MFCAMLVLLGTMGVDCFREVPVCTLTAIDRFHCI